MNIYPVSRVNSFNSNFSHLVQRSNSHTHLSILYPPLQRPRGDILLDLEGTLGNDIIDLFIESRKACSALFLIQREVVECLRGYETLLFLETGLRREESCLATSSRC